MAVCDLLLDVLGEVVDVLDAHAAGIDDLEVSLVLVQQIRQAIARHAGRGIDDRQPLSGKPIEQARFADVRAADDDNLRDGHGALKVRVQDRG